MRHPRHSAADRGSLTAGAALTAVLLAALTGCASGDSTTPLTISGDCALGADTLTWTTLVPKPTLERLVGPQAYSTAGGLVVEDDHLPAAFDGTCDLTRKTDGQDVLRGGLVNRKDPRYAEAKKLLASGDADGFDRVDENTYVIPTSSNEKHTAKAVAVLPDRFIVLDVPRPAKGTDATKVVGKVMVALEKKVRAISGPAMFTDE